MPVPSPPLPNTVPMAGMCEDVLGPTPSTSLHFGATTSPSASNRYEQAFSNLIDLNASSATFAPTLFASAMPTVDIDLSNDLLSFFTSLNPAIEAAAGFSTVGESPAECVAKTWPASRVSSFPPTPSDSPNAITSRYSAGADMLAAGETDLAIYASIRKSLDAEFYATLPAPVRESVSARLRQVTQASEVSKATTIALCMVYRAGMISDIQGKERLLKMSQTWFDKASTELWSGAVPVEAQIAAASDMWLHQLSQHGAAAGWAIVFLLDAIMLDCVGNDRIIDLGARCTPSGFMIACAGLVEVSRLLLLGDRKSLYKFINANPSPTAKPQDELTLADALQVAWGTPLYINMAILKIGDLMYERDSISPEEFSARAKALEDEIRTFPGVSAHAFNSRQGIEMSVEHSTHEMWRHAALIFLYQRLHGLGPLAVPVRRALRSIIALGSTVDNDIASAQSSSATSVPQPTSTLPPDCAPGSSLYHERDVQWWMAATVAVDDNDREICRRHLLMAKPQKLARANVDAIELVWQQVDEKGWCVDWRQVLAQHGRFIAFV
ncbi:hypothetical protein ACM66B_005659 [Microbotryomycetes sp. NB124-2]